jgi:hypothetical protein
MHRRTVGEEDSVEELQTLNHKDTKAVRDKTFVGLRVLDGSRFSSKAPPACAHGSNHDLIGSSGYRYPYFDQ